MEQPLVPPFLPSGALLPPAQPAAQPPVQPAAQPAAKPSARGKPRGQVAMGMGGFPKGGADGKGGKGKGFYGAKGRQAPAAPENFTVDESVRFKGTVSVFNKWQGYGFIELEQKGVVPNDKLFVHWSNILSTDRFPFLLKDQEVEFSIIKSPAGWGPYRTMSLRATRITMLGGATIAVQDSLDAEKKSFVGSQFQRFNGTLKFYNPARWFGYIVVDDGQGLGEEVPKEIRVDESEMNCGGRRPQQRLENVRVEFGIVRNRREAYLAYNVCMEGGQPFTKPNLEHRQVVDLTEYHGTVNFFNARAGWGFITPVAGSIFPPVVQESMHAALEKAKQKGKPGADIYFARLDCVSGFKPQQGNTVVFKLYMDDKGVGACEING